MLSELSFGILACFISWGNTNRPQSYLLITNLKKYSELLFMLNLVHILDQFLNHCSS